ncbi:MAG: single-stranded-DNA-specific exonuclease RecJ, partial [Burkholderiales bacterium]
MRKVILRHVPTDSASRLAENGIHPVLARIYAARGIASPHQLDDALSALLPLQSLTHAERMACLLADAIEQGKYLVIVADYDADGATACAVAVRALRALGAKVDFIVPNRFEYGYGLTPEIVALAARLNPDVLITVDNGMSSVDGVAEAQRRGIAVLITDHHLPGPHLPDAACIVNPNQPGCTFPSKNLCGVGVVFYVMLALRAELRRRSTFAARPEPNFGHLLDLVALGTVADVVSLDDNNRILVGQGIRRIRRNQCCAGIRSLMRVAGRALPRAGAYDLAFAVGPRLNAAGRLDDMRLGIECLITDDESRALSIAQQLDSLNRERRDIEAGMQVQALAALDDVRIGDVYSVCLFDPSWHPGVIGIVAARIKERFHRPVFAFAPASDGDLRGSGRSIRGLHLRDALDLVAKREPDLLQKFGGHAAAAGVSLRADKLQRFSDVFEEVARHLLCPAQLQQRIESDGALDTQYMTLELAQLIDDKVWGQGFPYPCFSEEFTVQSQRIVADKHLKLQLVKGNHCFEAMLFSRTEKLPLRIRCVYR